MADTRELQILLTLKDLATGNLDKTSKEAQQLKGKLEGVQSAFQTLAVGSGIAFAAISGGIYKAVQAAATLEQAEVAFSTMLGSGEKAKQLLNDLSVLASSTPFELTGIRQTAKQLLAFGITADEMIPTLKILGDVSAGVSVPIEQVAYAYGQVRTANQLYGTELRQFMNAGVPILDELAKMYGVTASEAKKMVEEGKVGFDDVEKAFQNMSGEGGRFFNMMEQQSQTFNGRMSTLKDTINKFLEDAGKPLLEQFKPMVEWIIKIVEKVGEWVKKNPELAAKLALFAAAVAGLTLVVATLGAVITGMAVAGMALGISLGAVAGILFGIPLAIAAVIAAGYMIYKHWDEIKAFFQQTWDGIKIIFWEAVEAVKGYWNSLVQKASEIWNSIKTAITVKILEIKHDIEVAWGTITGFFTAIWETISNIFNYAIAFIAGLIVLGFEAIGIDIVTWIGQVQEFFTQMWETIKDIFQFAWDSIKELIQTSIDIVTGIFDLWFNILKQGWTSFWNGLKLVFDTVWGLIKTAATAAWTWLKDQFNAASKPISDAWSNLWNGFKSTFEGIWEGIKNSLTSGLNWIIGKINSVIRAANAVASAGSKLPGVDFKPIGEIPKLAKGGIVTSPTLALIGEAGAEAVVPLDKMNRMGGVHITVTGNTLLDNEAGEKIGNQLIKTLQLNSLL